MRAAPWCTQCFLDLRPAPVAPPLPPPRATPTAAYAAPAPDPLTAPLHELGPVDPVGPAARRTWPCTACQADNPYERDSCSACGLPFLAGLHEDGVSLVLPLIGDLGAMSRARTAALAVGLVTAFSLLVLVLGSLLS